MNQEQVSIPTQPSNEQPPQKKKKGKGLKVLLILLLALALGVGSYFAAQFFFGEESEPDAQHTAEPEPARNNLTAQSVIEKVQEELAKTLAEQPEDTEPTTAMELGTSSSPSYKAEGKEYYVYHPEGHTLTFTTTPPANEDTELPRPIDTTIRTKVAEVYTSLGLTKEETLGDTEATAGQTIDVYTGLGVICSIDTPESTGSLTTARCGDLEKLEEVVAQADSLVSAIPNRTPDTLVGDITITDSPVEGYQRATLSITNAQGQVGGYAGLFYKVPSGEWQFFKGVQSVIHCSEYNSDDLRNAFRGEQCYDEASEETTTLE